MAVMVEMHDDPVIRALEADPEAFHARLRQEAPVFRLEAWGLWLVTRYEDVQAILRDTDNFTTGTPASLLYDTFGAHMLTTDGVAQERLKSRFRGAFAPAAIRAAMQETVRRLSEVLLDGLTGPGVAGQGAAEWRRQFASRLPVQSILSLFGLPLEEEPRLRRWYDGFERALANFAWREDVRRQAREDVAEFHALIQRHIDRVRGLPDGSLFSQAVHDNAEDRLSDAEIRQNAAIIFFGGISTVEAIILNCLYVLVSQPRVHAAVRADRSRLPDLLEETLRWLSPVQSATRHVARDVRVAGVTLKAGDTVNCMLGAANRDPTVFSEPDTFDLERSNARRHLAFASGPHFCLGSHFARLQALTALEQILDRCPDLRPVAGQPLVISGVEFRQPPALHLAWGASS